MMRKAQVLRNRILAGELTEIPQGGYIFRYDEAYLQDPSLPAISLTLPKRPQEYRSEYLFPFFFNMLSEGVNRNLQSRQLKIDENDYFGLLLATAQYDTIGAVTLQPIKENEA
ncbi:HipA N-terminal domain-containing protein [Sabulibacter ruber]|uniref:HipA N-terminal domain-containing protein n=1 Tax=Sabulibacter ruber TaxID=2811901 RepID=UPI001A9590E8|nr:HipA N-terminal domain-containing protein [Sabulibacter ruber]